MNVAAAQVIQAELEPSESLLWAGQPGQGIKLRRSESFMIPLSFLWGGFAIYWEYFVIKDGAPLFFRLFGIPFVLVGLYMMFGRFFVEAKQREKTFYGLTNTRVIIVSGLFRKKVRSLNLRTLTDISLFEASSGSGSITFGNSLPFVSIFGLWWPGIEQYMAPRFEFLSNARQVYQQILEAQKSAT